MLFSRSSVQQSGLVTLIMPLPLSWPHRSPCTAPLDPLSVIIGQQKRPHPRGTMLLRLECSLVAALALAAAAAAAAAHSLDDAALLDELVAARQQVVAELLEEVLEGARYAVAIIVRGFVSY